MHRYSGHTNTQHLYVRFHNTLLLLTKYQIMFIHRGEYEELFEEQKTRVLLRSYILFLDEE